MPFIQNLRHTSVSAGIAVLFSSVLFCITRWHGLNQLVLIFSAWLGLFICYNLMYLGRVNTHRLWCVCGGLLFSFAWFGLFAILPSSGFQWAFIILSVPVIFFLEYGIAAHGEQAMVNRLLLIWFSFSLAAEALPQYFLIPHVWFLCFVFVFTLLLVRYSYEYVPHTSQRKWTAASTLGLLFTELFWTSTFLPFHFSSTGLIIFSLMFACWLLYYHYLFHTLTLKKIIFNLSLAFFIIVTACIVTPWNIV